MPKYDYSCKKCLAVEEVVHSIHEDPDVHCTYCGSYMKRRPQKFQAQYKGDGFVANERYRGHGDADKGVAPDLPSELGGTLDTRKKK